MNAEEIIARFSRLKAALNDSNRSDVNAVCFSFIAENAELSARWRTIAKLMQHNGEYLAAHNAMANLVAASKNSDETRFEQAALFAQTGRLDQAWEIMQCIPNHIPDVAGNAFIKGTMAINMGLPDVAQKNLLRAIVCNPQLGQAMLSLAVSSKIDDANKIGDAIIAAENRMETADDTERAHYQYALGKVYFDRRTHELAFSAFAKGATIVAENRHYNYADDHANFENCRDGYDIGFIKSVSEKITIPTKRPIFVTGLPRSGTTLVEHILASHSEVIGGEELGRMTIVERDIGASHAGALMTYMQNNSPDNLAALYLHLLSERFGTKGRVVDKSLNISRHLGLVAAILPEARIIWLRRNPLDCAWSAFRTYFMSGIDWSWQLEDIAAHFVLEDQLFEHWTKTLGERVLVVSYEQLVNDPAPHIKRILAHCDLPEEASVFEPHKTKRIVTTASVMQVREPINTGAVGSAHAYRQYLQPFISRYTELGGIIN